MREDMKYNLDIEGYIRVTEEIKPLILEKLKCGD